jgi:hemoglobin
MRYLLTGLLILFVLPITSCSTLPDKTLYQRLGGEQTIQQIVDNLVVEIGHDEVVFHHFAKSNVTRFKKHLALHLCELTDGPCQYDGDNMMDIHTGMKVTEKEFNHLVDLLINAMNNADIPHTLQNQVLSRLAPLRSQVIYL